MSDTCFSWTKMGKHHHLGTYILFTVHSTCYYSAIKDDLALSLGWLVLQLLDLEIL